jgi:hypothetical protein
MWGRGVPVRLTFELPLPPRLDASGWGGHWRKKHEAKKKYWDLLDTLVTVRRLPRPLARWPKVQGTAEVRTCPIMDEDNAYRRLKWVWDWLQSRGYLVNDREVRCKVTPVASKRKEQGITLTIEPAA